MSSSMGPELWVFAWYVLLLHLENSEASAGPIDVNLQFHKHNSRLFFKDMVINLFGPFMLTRLLMASFIERGQGCVINTASRAGVEDVP